MSTEQFCLRWNDFHKTITSTFSDLRDDDEFLDVTLVCDGDIVRAHKLVLSACSPLFRIMLKKNSHPQPMIFLRGIRFPDMVAILNFMYHGEVNVNQEDLQNFLAAAEELRIKGLSEASSTDAKLEKLEHSSVPKMKQTSGDASHGQPPTKKPRESSPGNSPSSTPVSAKSPVTGAEEEEADPPQLSVKREFTIKRQREAGPGLGSLDRAENGEAEAEDTEDSQQSNLLDCLVQAQTFALQQAAGNKNFENNINNFSPQHGIMQGAGSGQMVSSQNDKGLMQFLGQNNASSAAANAIMMQRLLGSGYELHPLGSRKDNDPMAHIKVARSSKGWHCPQCIHISSTKGNLKSHILSGRHKSYTEKPFGCQYCDRSYGTKQSLQVHISTNHRAERDAEYQALSKNLGMKSFPDTGNFAPQSYDSSSVSQMPGLMSASASSSSLLQQMSASLQSSGQAMAANSAVAKFPELSITKHEPRMIEGQELQIIQKQEQGYNSCRGQEADIQEQINMLRTMPDFMRMQTPNIQEEEAEASGEEMEDEESNISHKGNEIYSGAAHRGEPGAARGAVHGGLHVGHVDTSITTP